MTKRKLRVDDVTSSRERTVTWHEDQKQFMLEWYIEYMKGQHAGFKFKKQHHMLCADALNKKFAMGVTVDQVDRQYRHYKENWKIVAVALSKSGNSFDHTRCLVTISDSEKANLCDRARRLLSKPIKFFKEMQELFTGCSADGSLAMDQNTCMDASDDSASDDARELIDLNGYTQPEDTLGEDSDTLPTSSKHPTGDNSCSSNNSRVGKKRPRGNNGPPTTKPSKNKSRLAECSDEIKDTLKSLRDTLAATAPPQMPQLTDPHASLWQRIEAIPMTPDQRVLVGEHLSSNENAGKRGWLCNARDDTLHAWVFKFLCEKEANDEEICEMTNALEDRKGKSLDSQFTCQGWKATHLDISLRVLQNLENEFAGLKEEMTEMAVPPAELKPSDQRKYNTRKREFRCRIKKREKLMNGISTRLSNE